VTSTISSIGQKENLGGERKQKKKDWRKKIGAATSMMPLKGRTKET